MILTPEFIKSDGMRLLLFASLYHRHRARRRGYEKKWRQENLESCKASQRKYNVSEKGRAKFRAFGKTDKCKANHEKYRLSEKGKALYKRCAKDPKRLAYLRLYEQRPYVKAQRQAHGKEMRPVKAARDRERWANDPHYRLVKNCRLRIRQALKMGGVRQKHKRTVELVGCSIAELKAHLESKFLPGMTWENHGRYGWHVEHIKPLAAHKFTEPGQLEACFHHTNLRPLWWVDNLKKGHKYEEPELITA